jgi:hypothetical protein
LISLSKKAEYKEFIKAATQNKLTDNILMTGNPVDTICVITTKSDRWGKVGKAYGHNFDKNGKKVVFLRFIAEFHSVESFLYPSRECKIIHQQIMTEGGMLQTSSVYTNQDYKETFSKGRGQVVVIPPDFVKNQKDERYLLYKTLMDEFHWGRSFFVGKLVVRDMLDLCLHDIAKLMDIRLTPYSERPTRVLSQKDLPFKITTGSDIKAANKMYSGCEIALTGQELGKIICDWLNVPLLYTGDNSKYFVTYIEPKNKGKRSK